jgi:hypothetical protein
VAYRKFADMWFGIVVSGCSFAAGSSQLQCMLGLQLACAVALRMNTAGACRGECFCLATMTPATMLVLVLAAANLYAPQCGTEGLRLVQGWLVDMLCVPAGRTPAPADGGPGVLLVLLAFCLCCLKHCHSAAKCKLLCAPAGRTPAAG